MGTIDQLNQRFGGTTITFGSGALKHTNPIWAVRIEKRSPRYTTKWDELANAN
jgi:DNA polymerase V